jgi:hypothetical protein
MSEMPDRGRPSHRVGVSISRTTSLWFACDALERPPDAFVVWHMEGCPACLAKARGQARRFPGDPRVEALLVAMGDL